MQNMKTLGFLNCLSCKHKKGHKAIKSSNTICNSNQSVDDLTTPPNSINKGSSQNGSVKETLSLSTVSHLNNSHYLLDARSLSLAHGELEVSKINLLPSESSSVIMKQSSDHISTLDSSDIFHRLDLVVKRLERFIISDNLDDNHDGLTMFSDIINQVLSKFVEISQAIGGIVSKQANLIKEAFVLTQSIMRMAQNYSKPAPHELFKLLQPLSVKLYEVSAVVHTDVSHPLQRQCREIADSASILSWINMSSSTVFVKDLETAAKVSANATIQTYRNSKPIYVEWMRAWLSVLASLREMVTTQYPVGVIWKPPGGPKPPLPAPAQVQIIPRYSSVTNDSITNSSVSPKKMWQRKTVDSDFNRDALMTDIAHKDLRKLNHVDGFSYED